jgi:hypothetical protein
MGQEIAIFWQHWLPICKSWWNIERNIFISLEDLIDKETICFFLISWINGLKLSLDQLIGMPMTRMLRLSGSDMTWIRLAIRVLEDKMVVYCFSFKLSTLFCHNYRQEIERTTSLIRTKAVWSLPVKPCLSAMIWGWMNTLLEAKSDAWPSITRIHVHDVEGVNQGIPTTFTSSFSPKFVSLCQNELWVFLKIRKLIYFIYIYIFYGFDMLMLKNILKRF